MPQNFFIYPNWISSINYSIYSPVLGISDGTIHDTTTTFYSTQNNNLNFNPKTNYSYTITTGSRHDDVTTLTFAQSNGDAPFARGSLVTINPTFGNGTYNYTGMCLDGGSNWLSYQNAGWDQNGQAGGTVATNLNPAWTTGFFFTPSYQTQLDFSQSTISAKLGDGYEQVSAAGLNNNVAAFSLLFSDRSDRESRAIATFVLDHGGIDPVPIMMPNNKFYNNPNLRFRLNTPKHGPSSYNINGITVNAVQAFDIL